MEKVTTRRAARNVLSSLRALIPAEEVSFDEAMHLAELQADLLLRLHAIDRPAVPSDIVIGQPHIETADERMPVSGATAWNGQAWLILLDPEQPTGRRRFTLFHEYAHIINHGHERSLYCADASSSAREKAELAADYFAGCVLMPSHLMRESWRAGVRRPADLAALYNVSEAAVAVRLQQLALRTNGSTASRVVDDALEAAS